MFFAGFFALGMLVAGAALMQVRFGLFRITQLNVLQIMFLSHVSAQLIPAYIIAQDPANIAGVTYLFYSSVATILIPLGGILADGLLRIRTKTHFYHVPVQNDFARRKQFAHFFLVYFAFCFLIFLSYIVRAPTIPIYDLIFGISDAQEHQLLRREASTTGLLDGMAKRFFMPVLFLLGLTLRKYFSSRPLQWLAFMAMLVAVIYNGWSGSKTPVATLFLMATFVVLIRMSEEVWDQPVDIRVTALKKMQRRALKRRRHGALLLCLMVVLYPLVIYLFLPAGQLGVGYVMKAIFTRIFFGPAENTYVAFEIFRNGAFTYFADINRLAALLDMKYMALSQEVAIYRGFGAFTNAPPAAIGTFYAQGGGNVVIFGVTFASFLFRFVENMLQRVASKTPLTLAFYAVLLFGAFRFSWANFHTMLASEVFLPMASIWLLWSVFDRKLRSANSDSAGSKLRPIHRDQAAER